MLVFFIISIFKIVNAVFILQVNPLFLTFSRTNQLNFLNRRSGYPSQSGYNLCRFVR